MQQIAVKTEDILSTIKLQSSGIRMINQEPVEGANGNKDSIRPPHQQVVFWLNLSSTKGYNITRIIR